jgi:acetyl-CoA carboxylase/biotin carboxylase 1
VRSILVYLNSDRNLMKLCQPLLENIAAMRNSSVYGPVLLQARFLLRQCSTASFEERIVQLREKLDRGRMNDIVYSSVSLDLMCALLFDRHSPTTAPVALELIIRRSYFGQGDITNIDVFRSGTEWRASWRLSARQAQTLHLLVNSGASPATATLSPAGPGVLVNGTAPAAVGHCLVAPDDTEFEAALPKFAQWAVQHGSGESGVIIAFVQVSNDAQPSAMAEKYGRMLRSSGVLSALSGSPVKRVTVMAYGAAKGPHIFTFTADRDFGEDTVLRNLHPATASRLELHRLNLNYNFEMFPTAFRKMHFYIATPKSPAH